MTSYDIKDPSCTFCGKSRHEVKKVVAATAAGICDECVNLCLILLIEEGVFAPQHREMLPEDIGLGYQL